MTLIGRLNTAAFSEYDKKSLEDVCMKHMPGVFSCLKRYHKWFGSFTDSDSIYWPAATALTVHLLNLMSSPKARNRYVHGSGGSFNWILNSLAALLSMESDLNLGPGDRIDDPLRALLTAFLDDLDKTTIQAPQKRRIELP